MTLGKELTIRLLEENRSSSAQQRFTVTESKGERKWFAPPRNTDRFGSAPDGRRHGRGAHHLAPNSKAIRFAVPNGFNRRRSRAPYHRRPCDRRCPLPSAWSLEASGGTSPGRYGPSASRNCRRFARRTCFTASRMDTYIDTSILKVNSVPGRQNPAVIMIFAFAFV